MMNRRKFISESGIKLGVLTLGSPLLLIKSCGLQEKTAFNALFSFADVGLINELGNVIIPPTDTPGAKDAQVGEFIALIIKDCYSQEDILKFKRHLADVNIFSRQNFGRSFVECNDQERIELVSKMENNHESYKSLKGLIVSAYLTSEIGMTQLFAYYPVPGRYNACTSNKPW